MAASNSVCRCISITSLAALATTSIMLSTPPTVDSSGETLVNRASGRASQDDLAYRGSGRLGNGRDDYDRGYGLAYRGSGRFYNGLLAYRGSERGIKAA